MDPSEDAPEEADAGNGGEPAAPSRPVDRWRHNTASGAVAAGLALGFQRVFDPERADTIAIEQEAPDEPVDREGVEVRFDPLSSRGTIVVVHRVEPGPPGPTGDG